MNNEEIRKLCRIKFLVQNGKRRFKSRKDRDYILDLKNLNITEEEAWIHILSLNVNYYYREIKYNLKNDMSALIFKKMINSKIVYIKLDIEDYNGEETVVWSFHEDGR